MTKYTIIGENGSEQPVSKSEFYEELATKRHYHYEDGGVHVLLPKTDKYREVYLVPKRQEWAIAKQIERDTRCLDSNGNICKGKCTGCSRNAERPNRTPASLEYLAEEGHDERDQTQNTEVGVISSVMMDNFHRKYSKLDTEMLALAEALLEGQTIKEHAEKLHAISPSVSFEATYQKVYRKYSKLKKEVIEFLREWS